MINTIAFIVGAIVGGSIAKYAFKKEKNLFNEILEIVIFYLIVYIISERISSVGWEIFFITGFIASITARAISSKFKEIEINFEKNIKIGKIGLLIGLENALRRRGFSKDEIKKIMIETGFNKRIIEEVLK